MGQGPGTLVSFDASGSSSEVAIRSQEQKLAAENLYRDANTLIYGDNKPSEDAIDRVVSKINKECVYLFCHEGWAHFFCSIDKKGKFSRKRLNEEEGDITYINEHNRVFNKKVRNNKRFNKNSELTSPNARLRAITTSILRKFAQASNEARLYRLAIVIFRFCMSTPNTYSHTCR